MEIGDNLNKENTWNRLDQEYPKAMEVFNDWLDGYKERVKWKTMFFKTKFHDMPFELQFGVLIQFMFEKRMGDGLMFDFDFNLPVAVNAKSFAKKLEYGLSKLETKL